MSVPKLVQENNDKYLVYEQASNGTDYRYTADSSRVKADIVLHEKHPTIVTGSFLKAAAWKCAVRKKNAV